LGVNLIHSALTKGGDHYAIVSSLMDDLSRARVEVCFALLNDAVCCLWYLLYSMTYTWQFGVCSGNCPASCGTDICTPTTFALWQVDLVDFSGPIFEHVDNRFAALTLVQKGLCDAALFSPQGKHPHGRGLLSQKA
jgi:hypothetical protein